MQPIPMNLPRSVPNSKAARRPGWWLAWLLLASLWPALGAAVTLSDNTCKDSAGDYSAIERTWQAQQFFTDAQGYSLTSVTLPMLRYAGTGPAQLDIYSDNSGKPGTVVVGGTLTPPDDYPSTLALRTFTAAGIPLQANTTYWVVLKSANATSDDDFGWSYTASSDKCSGDGFSTVWGQTIDSGVEWTTDSIYPFQMKVEAKQTCGPGIALTTGSGALWQQLALPCVPATTTVGTTLGAGTTGQLNAAIYANAAQNGWIMYGNDLPNNKNLLLGVTDPLTTGVGYWLKSFAAPAGGGNLTVTGTATPAPVTTGEGCASANGCAAIEVTTVAGADRYNLVGNPFPYNVDWAQVRVRVKTSGGSLVGTYTPSQAAGIGTGAANPAVMSNQIWIYNGNAYDTWTDVSVPNPGNLKYFQSFWVKVYAAVANGYTVELLIPAEESTHSQVAPASDTRLAAKGSPWYLVWLDWLIPPAAAEDTGFAPGQHPTARPLRGLAPPATAAAPQATTSDPTLDLLVTQGLHAEGLDPAQAEQAAHATALAEGREWYLRLKVDEPATGYRDHNSVLGQLLDAKDGYDPRDLVELPPFGKPYLTLVFPRPTWGAQAGDYASDFRAARRALKPGQRPVTLPAADWPFEIRADRPGTRVVLRWEGDPALLKRMQLLDLTTRRTINPTAKAYANGYPVTLTTGTRAFVWRYLGQTGAGL